MTISEKVAYLKGLADGLDLDLENSKEGKLLVKIIDILEDLGLAVEDLEVEVQAAGDELEALAEDVADVETMLFDELDEDDEDFGLILLKVIEQDGEQLLADIDDEQELDAVYQHFMEELFEEEEDG